MHSLKTHLALLAIALLSAPVLHAQVVINEVDADTPGTDAAEFIELYDGGVGNTSLNGLILVLFNGSDNQSYGNAIDLAGFSTDVNGFFVIGSASVAAAEIILPNNTIQNGADAVALFSDLAANFPNDTPVTATNLVDAIVYGTDQGTDADLIDVLTPGGVQIQEAALGDKTTDSNGRNPDGGAALDSSLWGTFDTPTPGGPNVPSLEITAFFDVASMSENGGSATLTILLDGTVAVNSDFEIEFGTDASELSLSSPATVPAGSDTTSVSVSALDDAWRDFDQAITVTVTDPLSQFAAGSADIIVTDDETGSPVGSGLRLNEVYPDSVDGDANMDFVAESGFDEFVELVNDSTTALDISGFTLSDAATVRHTFPAGTVLDPGCAIVVFGGKATEGRPAAYGGAIVQNANGANEFGLSLSDSGDYVSIKNPLGEEVAGYAWTDADSANGSYTMDPDLNATNAFTVHQATTAFSPFSPGTKLDGTPFCIASTFTLSVTPGSVQEDAGTGAATLTIGRSGDISGPLTVTILSGDTSEASIAANGDFLANEDEIDVPIDIENDGAADGTQTVTFLVSGPGFIDGTITLDVTDDGDTAPTGISINELDYDQPGDDVAEFVEIYDGGVGGTDLSGFVIVFYNGSGAAPNASQVFALNGSTTNAAGFYAHFLPKGSLQNGDDEAVALWRGAAATDFVGATPSLPPLGAVLVDAIVYNTGAGPTIHGALGYGGPDLADSNSSARSLSRLPDGTGSFATADPTPNATNGTAPADAYDTWAAGFPGIGGRLDDDDFDGLLNIQEFGFGFHPFVVNPLPDPVMNPATGALELTVPIGAEAGADPKTNFSGEWSIDGEIWSTADINIVSIGDSLTTGKAPVAGANVLLLRVIVTVAP